MKKIKDLIKNIKIEKQYGKDNPNILGISDDSRKIKKNWMFVAIKGLKVNGYKFIPQAIQNGASVIIAGQEPGKEIDLKKIVYILVKDSRKTLGLLASNWYDNPSKKLKIIGVTGTDGKTTTSNLIYWLLKESGKKVGLISTINAKIGNKEYDTGFHVTNPEPLLLQDLLAKMVKESCEFAVLEVTSHGLDQQRVTGVKFEIAVLTNITHEHLDYHKTWESYRNSKAKLFKDVQVGVINQDDKSFGFIADVVKKSGKIISYSLKKDSDLKAENILINSSKMSFNVIEKNKRYLIKTKILGEYNVLNILASISVARELQVSWLDIQKALITFKPLIGRLEEIKNSKGIKIYVDFAHTPNALEKVLTLLKGKEKLGKLICVFGCAGERDVEKRKIMPEISIKLADISVFTAEDPRKEKVEDILEVMSSAATKVGGRENKNFYSVPERGEAIYFAINKLAKKLDTVVICGKGHEKSMDYNGIEYPWSDQEAIKSALRGKIKKIVR